MFSQQELDDVAWKLNTRPRKTLGWTCPAELFLPDNAFDFKAYWADKLNIVALIPILLRFIGAINRHTQVLGLDLG